MKIITTPHPTLKKKTPVITIWTDKLQQQADEMIHILRHTSDPEGIGLAAPQVNLSKRFFILLLDGTPTIYINPTVTKSSTKMLSEKYKKPEKRFLEGCLSIPLLWGFVDRPLKVTLRYQTPEKIDGKWQLISHIQNYSDQFSSYVQHERDHLNGILFTDHILQQKGTIFKETSRGLEPVSLWSLKRKI